MLKFNKGFLGFICVATYGFIPYLSAQTPTVDSVKTTSLNSDTVRLAIIDKIVSPADFRPTTVPAAWSGVAFSTLNLTGHSFQQIDVSTKSFHVAEKSGRQLFSEIPGAMIYDMDGSGNQINVAIRGLDPHRSWEFNIRQNGIITNSDMYGYPASHYSMPLEAVKSIEIIKGTAALQYGAQFGGMINYTLKEPSTKKIHYEGQHNRGSFGLLSTYNSLSGTLGKFSYFSYIHYRQSTGYRKNGESQSSAFHARATYRPNAKLYMTAELSNSQYLYHIPGPLGLSQFLSDPQQSTRSRNYFQPNIYLPGFTAQYTPNNRTTLSLVVSAIRGLRNSVQFEGFANKPDTLNLLTQTYANRSVDIDQFRSYTSELRLKKRYQVGKISNSFTAGLRAFNNVLWRRQLGKGTTFTDFDLSVEPNSFKRDLKFHSQSLALSVENAINISPGFTISPGFRYEIGNTASYGSISYLLSDSIPRTIHHNIPALGLSTRYKPNSMGGEFIAGVSQAHRPVIFKDIIPGSALERTARGLKDARGYNAEISYSRTHFLISKKQQSASSQKQQHQSIQYSLSLYQTQYNNRMGNWVMFDSLNAVNYIQKTNIGNSRTRGFECLLKYELSSTNKQREFSIVNATAIQQAKYLQATAIVGGKNTSIAGNHVEGVPVVISRTSLNFQRKQLRATLLYSYVSAQYSDAANTVAISANGSVGKVPSYALLDLNWTYAINKSFQIRGSVNNLLNKQYYTKRPTMYPGPGIWPSDGRGFCLGLTVQF